MAHATWNGIVQRALLGTERAQSSAISDADGELAAALERVDGSDAERAVLASAAIVAAYESAGRLPSRVWSSVVEAAPSESDDQPAAPMRVARFLVTILGGVNSEVMREWFAAVHVRGWRAPSPLLPALLDLGTGAPYLQKVILPALGARGRWLAGRNSDWSWAATEVSADEVSLRGAWEIGTPEERIFVLGAARAHNAAFGRELLESTWADEPPSQRPLLLARLEVGVSPDDEPFLERALDDRRQEVRRTAANLLCRLPSSALVARMTTRALSSLQWKPGKLMKKGEIVVEPPAELDAAMARDGIEKKPPQGLGERAWWLAQILGAVPLNVWTDAWNVAPETIVSVALKGDWGQALTEGWAVAARLRRDAAWAEALLSNGVPSEQPTPFAPKVGELLAVLPNDVCETFITKVFRDDPKGDTGFVYAGVADHAWSATFSRTVLDRLRKRLTASSPKTSAVDWCLRELVPRLALRVPATLAGATDGWPTGDAAGPFGKPLERFISVLTFRRELAEELDR